MAEGLREKLTKNKRLIWLIIILLLLLIIAGIIYLLYFYPRPQAPVNLNNNLNQGLPLDFGGPTSFNQPSAEILSELKGVNGLEEAPEETQTQILFVANAFAERFGSYSNQSDFKNLDDLNIFMTDSMKNWIRTYKTDLQQTYSDFDTYYAIETKAISSQIESLDETLGLGQIMIKTQRQEYKNDPNNPRIFYQDIKINVKNVDGQWKVDGAYWQ